MRFSTELFPKPRLQLKVGGRLAFHVHGDSVVMVLVRVSAWPKDGAVVTIHTAALGVAAHVLCITADDDLRSLLQTLR